MQAYLIKKRKKFSYLIFGAVLGQIGLLKIGRVFILLPRYMWIVNMKITYAVTGFLVRVISPSHKNVELEALCVLQNEVLKK